MKTIDLNRAVNRWDELVAALEHGETVEFVKGGMPVGTLLPDPSWATDFAAV